MHKRAHRIGNCPRCGLCVVVVGRDKTPKHGHIKSKHGKNGWLPSCSGSGRVAANIYPA